MIKSLVRYYERKKNSSSGAARFGWQRQPINIMLMLDEYGKLLQIESMMDGKRPKEYVFPIAPKRTTNITANILYDTTKYLFDKTPKQVLAKAAFRNKVCDLSNISNDRGVKAVLAFLDSSDMNDQLNSFEIWRSIVENGDDKKWFTFQMIDEARPILLNGSVPDDVDVLINQSNALGQIFCPIIGRYDERSKKHFMVKGVPNTSSGKGTLVCFNNTSFESYGWKSIANCVMGKYAMTAYTSALNMLLAHDSTQKVVVGKNVFVFWADEAIELESSVPKLFNKWTKDDPDKKTGLVGEVMKSYEYGSLTVRSEDANVKFHILALAGNQARIAIKFHATMTASEIAKNIKQHFDDMALSDSSGSIPKIRIRDIIDSLDIHSDSLRECLEEKLAESIIQNKEYNFRIHGDCLRRLSVDYSSGKDKMHTTHNRCAVLKACVNRKIRNGKYKNEKEVGMSLDLEQKNKGYLLGRLFNILEHVEFLGNAPGNIAGKYMGLVCERPGYALPKLMKEVYKHILPRLKGAVKIKYEKMAQGVLDQIDSVPSKLDANGQSMFFLGHAQQNIAIFKDMAENKKQNKNEVDGSDNSDD